MKCNTLNYKYNYKCNIIYFLIITLIIKNIIHPEDNFLARNLCGLIGKSISVEHVQLSTTRWCIAVHLSGHQAIQQFTHSFIQPFVYSSIHQLTHSFIHRSSIHLCIYPPLKHSIYSIWKDKWKYFKVREVIFPLKFQEHNRILNKFSNNFISMGMLQNKI